MKQDDALILYKGTGWTIDWKIGGDLKISTFIEGIEVSDPLAQATNAGRLYFRDNGSGKSELVVRFNSVPVQVIATEP